MIAHYREQAKAAGFDIQMEMTAGATVTIGGERKRDGSTLSVTATQGAGDKISGQLIIGSKKG